MGMKKYRFVEFDRDVWLPDNITVEIKIIPASATNVRSRQPFTGQTLYTQHETANSNRGAGADMHYRYLSGNPNPAAGYNFVVDDLKIIQLTPMNEVTWAAGTPDGNRLGYHVELCVNEGINHTVARKNAAALAGGVLAAKGWGTDRLVQHNYWTGKNCPLLLRRDGLWPSYVNQVAAFISQAKAAAAGKDVSAPVAGTIIAGDYVKVLDNLNVRQGYGTKHKIVKTLPAGSIARVGKDGEGNFRMDNDGYTWYNLSFDGGTGWAAGDWLAETTAPKPATPAPAPKPAPADGWPYPDPIVPPFWDALMKDGATFATHGKTTWFRTNDLYEVKSGGTDRLQKGIKNGEVVGPKLKEKDRFRSAALGVSELDGKPYVITPGLTMVALEDLIFVQED